MSLTAERTSDGRTFCFCASSAAAGGGRDRGNGAETAAKFNPKDPQT